MSDAHTPEPEMMEEHEINPSPDAPEGGDVYETSAPDDLESLQHENAALRDQVLRLKAEIQNTRRRADRERAEAIRYAEADFARELLLVLDDLERMKQAAEEAADRAPAHAEGVRIVHEHFLKVLKAHQIEPIEAVGQPFDPTYHEALLQQPSDEHPAGTVLQEVTRGYRMRERVLRSARVIVSGGPAAGPPDETPTPGD